RLEKVDLRSSRSIAKIVGTVVCLAGAMLMAFFKGPKLLGALLLPATGDWVKGGIYLMGNAFCFSIWYILQASIALHAPWLENIYPVSIRLWTTRK
uniref:WAT1-related protein n=1 Tax=Aegilops tauschii subsp. strangulata TaxID=200361 RepID=A0A453KWC0_AEGTS